MKKIKPKLENFKGKTIKKLWIQLYTDVLNISFTDGTCLKIDIGPEGIKTSRKEIVTRDESVEYTLYRGRF